MIDDRRSTQIDNASREERTQRSEKPLLAHFPSELLTTSAPGALFLSRALYRQVTKNAHSISVAACMHNRRGANETAIASTAHHTVFPPGNTAIDLYILPYDTTVGVSTNDNIYILQRQAGIHHHHHRRQAYRFEFWSKLSPSPSPVR